MKYIPVTSTCVLVSEGFKLVLCNLRLFSLSGEWAFDTLDRS